MLLPVDELLHGLTCEDIIKAESAVKFTVEQLGTLEGDELNHCFPMLGQDKLSSKQAQVLWNQIKKVMHSVQKLITTIAVKSGCFKSIGIGLYASIYITYKKNSYLYI